MNSRRRVNSNVRRFPLYLRRMFDQLEQKRSGVVRISLRGVVSVAAGAILTFLVPAVLGAVWSSLQDNHYQPHRFAVLLVRILNLPAVLYCRFFSLPPGLPRSDESLYCWSLGFFFNIPYYAIVIFVVWSLVRWGLDRFDRRHSAGRNANQ